MTNSHQMGSTKEYLEDHDASMNIIIGNTNVINTLIYLQRLETLYLLARNNHIANVLRTEYLFTFAQGQ